MDNTNNNVEETLNQLDMQTYIENTLQEHPEFKEDTNKYGLHLILDLEYSSKQIRKELFDMLKKKTAMLEGQKNE
jgi:hypothetical protein